MADDLPRYVSTSGVNIQPAMDVSDTFDQYQKIFGAIEEVTRPIAQSYEADIGKEEGEYAGQNPGFQPGPSIGIASRAYNQAGLAANKLQLISDASQKINQFKMEAQGLNPDGTPIQGSNGISPESIDEFNGKLKAYGQATLSTVPSANRQAYSIYLSAQATAAAAALRSKLIKKQTIANNINVVNQVDQAKQNILDMTSTGGVVEMGIAKKVLGQTVQSIQNEAIQNNFPFKLTERLTKDLKESYMSGHILGVFNNKLNDDPQSAIEYINQVRTSPELISQLGEAGANAKANELKSIMNSRLQTEGVTAKSVDMQSNAILMSSWKDPSSSIDQTQLQHITEFNALSGKKENTSLLLSEVPIAKEAGSYVTQYQNSDNLNIQSNIKSELTNKINSLNYKDPLDVQRRMWYQKSLDQINQLDKLRQEDLVGYIKQTPGYKSLEQKTATFSEVMKPLNQNGIQYIKSWQLNHGVDPQNIKVMSKSDIQSFNTNWSTASPAYKNQLMNNLTEQYGQDVGLAMNQLEQEKNGPHNLMTFYNFHSNPNTVGSLQMASVALSIPKSNAEEVFKANGTNWDQAKQAIKSDASDSISLFSNIPNYNPVQVDHKLDSAAYLASYMIDQEKVSPDKAYKKAADLIFNDHVTSGSVNGSSFAIPNYDIYGNPVPSEKIPAMLKVYQEYKINEGLQTDQFYPRNGITDKQASSNYADDVKLNGYWVNTQGGWVLMNGLNRQVRDLNGNPIKVMISDTQDPKSEPNQILNGEIDRISKMISESKVISPESKVMSPDQYQDFALKYIENRSMFAGSPYSKQMKEYIKKIGSGMGEKLSNQPVGSISFGAL